MTSLTVSYMTSLSGQSIWHHCFYFHAWHHQRINFGEEGGLEFEPGGVGECWTGRGEPFWNRKRTLRVSDFGGDHTSACRRRNFWRVKLLKINRFEHHNMRFSGIGFHRFLLTKRQRNSRVEELWLKFPAFRKFCKKIEDVVCFWKWHQVTLFENG